MGSPKAKSINDNGLSKTEFARYVADRLDMPITYCKQSLTIVLDGILMAMEDGYDLCFSGFGSFENHRREPFVQREGMLVNSPEGSIRNAVVPASYVVKFTPSTTFKQVAKKYGEEKFGENDTTYRKGERKTNKTKEI